MSVYVDDANIGWRGKKWCHLYADSLPELEEFARLIGLSPAWLQDSGFPHYDVTGVMRARAVAAGAIDPPEGTYRRLRQAQRCGEYE